MFAKKPWDIDPQIIYLGVLALQFVLLFYLMTPMNNPMVFLFLLSTVFSMVLRWRIPIKPVYMWLDVAFIILAGFFYPQIFLCIIVVAYYFAYNYKLLYVFPLFSIGFLSQDSLFYWLLLQAVLFGTIMYYWSKSRAESNELTDDLRRRIYELELTQARLLADYQDAEKLSRLTERQRIAEMLHDDLGHELTAAQLSLRAYKTLLESGQIEKANETLPKIEQKLDYSLTQLKETVKQIEPTLDIGFHDLKHMVDEYTYPVQFTHKGSVQQIKPYMWQLMLMSVKEGLTNITKHANPHHIHIGLETTDFIVRLVIENDGVKANRGAIYGSGLRYMRNRLEAVNGSLSVQSDVWFKLIIIIPFETGR